MRNFCVVERSMRLTVRARSVRRHSSLRNAAPDPGLARENASASCPRTRIAVSPPSLSAIATELRQRHLPHWPSRSRSSRASAALFPTFTSFVKVGSTGRGGRPREPGLGQRASGGASLFSRERCPMLGARHTKTAAKGGTRQSCPPLHLFQILEGGIREAERGARAGPVRSVGGRGCGGRRSPPFARDPARPRAPERLVCEGVGCGAGCGTRCGPPTHPAAARGDAPLARGRTGGGSVSGRRSVQAAPRRSRAPAQRGGGGRRLIAPQRTAYPLLAAGAGQPQRTRFAA